MIAVDALRVEALTVRWGGVRALDTVSLSVAAGEIIGVVGPSGAGKTALIDAIAGWVPIAGGRIVLNGSRVDGMAPHRIAACGIACTHQTPRVFAGLTALENAVVGAHRASGSRQRRVALARAAFEYCGLAGRSNVLGSALSPSEQCRLALARALAGAPRLLLLDEPFRLLDRIERGSVARIVADVARESHAAVIVAERDPDVVASLCSRIAVLHAGVKIAEGSYAAIAGDIDVRDAYLGVEWRQ